MTNTRAHKKVEAFAIILIILYAACNEVRAVRDHHSRAACDHRKDGKPCAIIVYAACDNRFRPFNATWATTQKLMSTCPPGGKKPVH